MKPLVANQMAEKSVWVQSKQRTHIIDKESLILKRNKIESFVETWMDLESFIQSEVSQKENKTIVY